MIILILSILWAADFDLQMKKETTIYGEEVRLKDVVSEQSYSVLQKAGVPNLSLTPAPRLGGSRLVQRIHVEQALMGRIDADRISFSGQANTIVRRKGQAFSEAGMETAIREWIGAQETSIGTLHVDDLRLPRLQQIPRGDVSYKVNFRGTRGLIGRRALFVDIMVDGSPFRTVTVQSTISVEAPAPRLIRDVQRGELIREDMVDWQYVRLTDLRAPLLTPEGMRGVRARSLIKAGSVLTQNEVELVPVVERNRPVVVTAKNGPLTIRLKGVSLDEGGIGEYVRVRNPDSREIFLARIGEDGDVVLAFNLN